MIELALSLSVLLGGGGCIYEPPVDAVRRPFDPPEVYTRWWTETEVCSARAGRFGEVSWYLTPYFPESSTILGQWRPPHDITIRQDVRLDRPTVMHEILHDLLDGDGGHADPAWSACELPLGIG